MSKEPATARKWLVCAGANLLMGVPLIVPVWIVSYFAASVPLAALGWTRAEPTDNDGLLPWLVVLLPSAALFFLWWLANSAIARRTGVRGRAYWSVSAATALVPTLVCVVVTTLL
ncbi:hypothetical protein V1L54_09345 [Streptomyces sp. TRM 70361]|uniref:hypothetical protein n=1 Tax=Streptomyces sp. TRM 70361 TaxID=3116553 RepID=UPI002E7C2728|nr:hypothetical protein [Streptomyces sp. TRM 70361]MEE1939619.1 hypothetical protein [Streptomyces sp. TRM 70361]